MPFTDTVSALYKAISDNVTKQLALTSAEKELCDGGKVTATLASPYSFLSLVAEKQAVFLNGDRTTKAGRYENAHVELKLANRYAWSVPIEVTLTACTIKSLSFSESRLQVAYKIGTEEMTVPLPSIDQVPDCSRTFGNLNTENVVSQMAKE